MKKRELIASALLAAAALLAVAGCQKQEGGNAGKAVSFSVSVAGQEGSKAVLYNDNAALEALGAFKCSAYNVTKSTAVFNDQTVSYGGSKWTTVEEYNWYPGETLTFCAYAPTGAAGVTLPTDGSGIGFSCSVADNAEDQTDVMLGYYSGDGNYTGTANINFQHPLTAVRFKMGDLAEFIPGFTGISKIEIANVHNEGTLTTWSGDDTFTWTPSTTYKKVTMEVSGTFEKGADIVGTDDNAQAFTLVPQNLSTKAATIIVTYDATEDGIITAIISKVSETGTDWEAGKVYTYTINFKTMPLTIRDDGSFNPVNGWVTETTVHEIEGDDTKSGRAAGTPEIYGQDTI